ncbi:hypothetical protein AMATHDRAFT_66733 [Amanita thiersii Skay4041]|uniref:Cytochrome P450 n=1 Tax=Amanita thiersii Skay4041 TaxID=703135 RepID=A0A2A9NHQ9_9AGAR|nr:hypothetical protein AMATHDRAFT_66733 [Amanita thiersii Skay4041]
MATTLQQIITDSVFTLALLWIVTKIIQRIRGGSSGTSSLAKLQGPRRESLVFGFSKQLREAENRGVLYEEWASQHGAAFLIPSALNRSRLVICDPKAITHFFARETFTYVQLKFSRVFIERMIGKGILWAEGESHKRQRKALSPAFSNAQIRKLTNIFYDSGYKLKMYWDAKFESGDNDVIIEVQHWMNRISLDSVGIAGFGHDFGTLDGKRTPVMDAFNSFSEDVPNEGVLTKLTFLLGPLFPVLLNVPTPRGKLFKDLRIALTRIADGLLERSRKEKQGLVTEEIQADKSIIGLLVRAESSDTELYLSQEEIIAQVNVLLLAGYETTSISLTWALIELCKNQEIQQKLRDELRQFSSLDPTWDQLTSSLPYLDAVLHETLRVHPPVSEITRVAGEDDIMPFGAPLTTRDGQTLTSLAVPKGTIVSVPIVFVNQSETFWGPDAKKFIPERWLSEPPETVKDLIGHRHLYTFSDGPRMCLGRGFAMAEFKAVLSILIRNYAFELPEGPTTEISTHPSILPRPRVAGEEGARVPLRVRRPD